MFWPLGTRQQPFFPAQRDTAQHINSTRDNIHKSTKKNNNYNTTYNNNKNILLQTNTDQMSSDIRIHNSID